MNKLVNWCKEHILAIGLLFLLAFIPLYPKLPLVHVIRTWVYIRLEDFFTAAVILAYILIEFFRKRAFPKSPVTLPILVYWGVGLLSLVFSLVFIGPKLEGYFPHIAILHYLRRIEYMMLFFVAYSVVARKPEIVKWIVWTLAVTIFAVFLYGVGQKFFGFPAFLTMNEEFAKGVPLRLPPTARIASTFGGHYDLAAYLVLMIPVLGSLVFGVKRFWQKIVFFFLSTIALVLLLFTASRVSFGVYIIAIMTMLFLQRKKLLIIPVIAGSILLLNFTTGTAERFYKTFRFSDVVVDLSTGRPIGTLDKLEGASAVIKKSESPATESLPTGSGFINVPAITAPAAPIALGPTPSPTPTPKPIRTVELYKSTSLATGSGEVATISGSFLIQKALVYDISITTRFQGQWPKATEAFKRNILLGSGYSTVSLAADGDYHRMLGETGILGTLSFLGIFFLSFVLFFRNKDTLPPMAKAFVIGVYAGIVGLFFNAVLIDVFEASKVAFTLWMLLGAATAVLYVHKPVSLPYAVYIKKFFTHPLAYISYLVIILFLLYGSSLSGYFLGDDFTWLRWAAHTSFREIVGYTVNASGFFYRPIPKLFYLMLFSVFWLKPLAYHVISLILFAVICVGVYGTLRRFGVRTLLAWLTSLLFVVLSIHHENIIWISGQSSLLAGAFFFISLLLYQVVWFDKPKRRALMSASAIFFLGLSMLSYDGMMVAPLAMWFIAYVLYPKRTVESMIPLLLIPLYWFARVKSGALPPSGDYGYRLSRLPVNILGNSVGYMLSIFFGPKIVELFSQIRDALRSQMATAGSVGIIVLGVFAALFWKIRPRVGKMRESLLWFVCALIFLVPYIGLGGMAERYTLVFSAMAMIALGMAWEFLWKRFSQSLVRFGSIALIVILLLWNIRQLSELKRQWEFASNVSGQSLLTIKTGFFPIRTPTVLTFVNVPIRYGRAWIFPTGLSDALWHTFRESPYIVNSFPTQKDAFAYTPPPTYTWHVLVFEDYKIKRGSKEVQIFQGD